MDSRKRINIHGDMTKGSGAKLGSIDTIVPLSAAELNKKNGGNSFDKTMKKVGKDINESDPYAIYGT